MPNLYIILFCSVLIAVSTAWTLYRTCYSAYFRKKIASEHGFFEGIITGTAYPLVWVAYGLQIIQLVSFIAFQGGSEILLAIRFLLFLLTAFAFFIFQAITPPLVALWFGKTAFWDSRGESGKHLYTDIYGIKVHKKKNSTVINSQQIYKLTFYLKDEYFLLLPKKYSCKMTAHNISALAETVDFKNSQAPSVTKKSIAYSVCLPIFTLLIALALFLQTISTGIFNPVKYSSELDPTSSPSSEPIESASPITDVVTNGKRIYVFYGSIGAVNVYDADGSYSFSLSLPYRFFNSTDIAFSDGNLLYKSGNDLYIYSADGYFISKEAYRAEHEELFIKTDAKIGETPISFDFDRVKAGDTFIVKPAAYIHFLAPHVLWPITVLLIILLFGIRFYAYSDKENEG